MHLQQRINAFARLGTFLSQFSQNGIQKHENVLHNDLFFDGFRHQIRLAQEHNGWFTEANVLFALEGWSQLLTEDTISKWLASYDFDNVAPANIAIIMAGNIPLVGFHDFLCVLLAGHKCIIRQSSNDRHLLPYLAKYLEHVEPGFKRKICFTEEQLTDFDAVIATGSDNTSRYFDYYFRDKPSIVRKNRNSVAILTGNETDSELIALSEDIFRYYGLGCRNVSKIFVPKDYNFDRFFNAMYHWHSIINQTKYANNYDYNKAVYLMSEFEMLENGFLMLKKDDSYGSPIATVFYEHYPSIELLKSKLKADADKIQCVVSKGIVVNEVDFGNTQRPELWDYADGVDTITFLLKLG
ncbi:MAG TPA: acyl-CoA reductase [Aquaticitalea sp.]|nr:acyl-CoA reductase [Aquaticitalea sp.]HNU60029.1 acyl-CoA reductase [Aquaticitalea sp.]